MEKIEVTARFDTRGKVIPISFVWKGRIYRAESVGRSWKADDGFHILVMNRRNRAYHLLFVAETTEWFILRGGGIPTVPLA